MQVKIPCGKDRLNRLFRLEDKLHEQGIHFDTGYEVISGMREWSLDWSLSGATAEKVLDIAKKGEPELFKNAKITK